MVFSITDWVRYAVHRAKQDPSKSIKDRLIARATDNAINSSNRDSETSEYQKRFSQLGILAGRLINKVGKSVGKSVGVAQEGIEAVIDDVSVEQRLPQIKEALEQIKYAYSKGETSYSMSKKGFSYNVSADKDMVVVYVASNDNSETVHISLRKKGVDKADALMGLSKDIISHQRMLEDSYESMTLDGVIEPGKGMSSFHRQVKLSNANELAISYKSNSLNLIYNLSKVDDQTKVEKREVE